MPPDISADRMRIPILLFALLAALPGPLTAQAGPPAPSADRVSATGGVLLKAGEIAGETRLHLGGWGGLMLNRRLAVGGGGAALLNNLELAGSEGDSGFVLEFGYGGLFFRYWEPLSGTFTGEAGILLGAGHAEVRDELSRREVGSDNFLVGEGELGLVYTFLPRLHLGLSVGYRLTAGVEDLPRVSAGDLNTFTATLSLRAGGY